MHTILLSFRLLQSGSDGLNFLRSFTQSTYVNPSGQSWLFNDSTIISIRSDLLNMTVIMFIAWRFISLLFGITNSLGLFWSNKTWSFAGNKFLKVEFKVGPRNFIARYAFAFTATWKICSSFPNTLATCLRSFFLIQSCTFKFSLLCSKLIQRLPEVTHRLLYFEVCWKLSNLVNSNLGLRKRLSCNRFFLKKKKKKWAFALTLTTDNIKINKQVFPQT